MAIVSSGAISLGTSAGTNRSISAEFGGTAPHSLSEYYGQGNAPASGEIQLAADFYGTSNVSPMSTTNFARINSSNNTSYITRTITSGIVFNSLAMNFRLRRVTNFVYYEIQNAVSAATSSWFNTSGTSQGSMGTSYVTMGRFNLDGITSIKMNWALTSSPSGSSASIFGNTALTGATYSASDNTFQTVSNNQSIGARLNVMATAECFAQNTSTGVVTMDVTARKSGFTDTTLGTYRHEVRAVAISNNCF